MSNTYFVVSEWLPKTSHRDELISAFKKLAETTLNNEKDCLRYHVTEQAEHPGATGKTQFTLVSIQEYTTKAAFDKHCSSDYVADFASKNRDRLNFSV